MLRAYAEDVKRVKLDTKEQRVTTEPGKVSVKDTEHLPAPLAG